MNSGEIVRSPRRVRRPAPAHVDEGLVLGTLAAVASGDAPESWGDMPAVVSAAGSSVLAARGAQIFGDNTSRLLAEVPPHYGKTH